GEQPLRGDFVRALRRRDGRRATPLAACAGHPDSSPVQDRRRSAGRAGGVSTGRTSAPNTASAASQDDARGTKLPTRTRPTPKWTLISRVQSHRAGSGINQDCMAGTLTDSFTRPDALNHNDVALG